MKQFFKILFASMLGFILGIVVLMFMFVIVLAGIFSSISSKQKTTVKANSVLALDLNYDIPERTEYNIRDFSFTSFETKVKPGLNDILKDIAHAKEDPNIKGIYLDYGIIPTAMATVEQIRNALIDFKKSKKFIIAYSKVYTQKAYYIATVADKIFLNPQGAVEFKGLGVQIMFFKNMLEKLGVETQVFYVGKFKTATEPFRYDKMSEPNKVMTTSLLENIQSQYMRNISASRGIPVSQLDSISDNLLIRNAYDARNFKMVDELAYYDQVRDYISKQLNIGKNDEINFVKLTKYNDAESNDDKKEVASEAKIAVLYAYGEIVDGKGDDDNIGDERFVKEIEKLRNNNKIKAIVFRVNSPGGSALASDIIWREISITNAVKPVIVSMGDYAASGGYYISCAATKIVAEPNTLTGSIGVFGIVPNFQKLLNEKLGITFDGVGTGKYSDLGNISRPLREDEKQIIQTEIDSIYHTFLSRVSAGRKMTTANVDSIAQGRVWTGEQALSLGLVDTLGELNDAVKIAAKAAGISKYRIAEYPEVDKGIFKYLEAFTDDKESALLKNNLGTFYGVFKKIKYLSELKGAQARMNEEFYIY